MQRGESSGARRPIFPPFAQPGPRTASWRQPVAEGAADPPAEDDLPAIEQFLDELPSIEDYVAAAPGPDEGWAIAGWQSYDWSGLASLGRQSAELIEAEASWSESAWEPDARPGATLRGWAGSGPTASEVAAALDGIAVRIRSGELPIEQFRGMPPEAAMAAALAALLRLRG